MIPFPQKLNLTEGNRYPRSRLTGVKVQESWHRWVFR